MAAAGMAWAAWEWKGDFGIHTWEGPNKLDTPIDEELVAVLVSQSPPDRGRSESP
jgi:hypothetical protein